MMIWMEGRHRRITDDNFLFFFCLSHFSCGKNANNMREGTGAVFLNLIWHSIYALSLLGFGFCSISACAVQRYFLCFSRLNPVLSFHRISEKRCGIFNLCKITFPCKRGDPLNELETTLVRKPVGHFTSICRGTVSNRKLCKWRNYSKYRLFRLLT